MEASTKQLIEQGPKKISFFSVPYIILAAIAAIIFLIIYSVLRNTRLEPVDEFGFAVVGIIAFIVSFVSFLFGISRYFQHKGTLDIFNENKDGVYYHYCNDTSMLLDSINETLTLTDGNMKKTYSFADIRCWEFQGQIAESYYQTGGVGTGMLGMAQAASGALNTVVLNQAAARQALDRSVFMITVKDLNKPTWEIKFYPNNGSYISDRRKGKGMDNVILQLRKWMEVFNQVVNRQ